MKVSAICSNLFFTKKSDISMACKRKVAIGLFGFWTGMGEFGGRDRVHCLIFCTILKLQQNLNKTCEKYEENIKCVDCRDRLCGFGTQILNEFPENINKIWRIFSESKTWSKYSNRIPYDGTGNVSIQICQMQRWGKSLSSRYLYLWLQLGHELQDKSLGVFFMLGVGEVQVCGEVLVQPRSKVMASL